ncbi:hypothetical protein DEJ16_13910 [Curtobacterium sp. MCJR17_055]|uniref:sporulation-delaying protein SdpB family protein n=1 Tax=unclassified Curtobacterium TaxID=257496 RepID=UPI000DA0A1EC|nr:MULTISPECIES: sporulation-delaying protein SdpB family protein [unclassified Curtobacterium]PYY33287.1 hypothetical protein DEI87_12370 [Curtobacterium sp. MCBD17_029]PYY53230.1 hypothetical protein DEJ16_13910 [Curtobacterium sp. MCJR17_055]PYY56385.1 hypothetical protein DEJ26_13150 [Curtobacterium sp. MCPF17_015]PZE90069.1 hypothetical protein DEI95_12505 [Curtobacterium sp. MCBD17_008]WIB35687.1 hypothetical protein DEJ15_16330 [Curtobacterium sp. MCJR17_043]
MPDRRRWTIPYPWGAGLGVARSVLYAGMALTLLMNPAWILFTVSTAQPEVPVCDSYNGWALFCLFDQHLDVARVLAGSCLLVFASGVLPWLTAVPAAYLIVSASVTMTLGDGGDQLYGILGLLLLPLSCTDWRRTSWSSRTSDRCAAGRGSLAFVGWALVRSQIFVVYLEASVGKLAVPEWANGTALYYWLRSPTFGPGPLLAPVIQAATIAPLIAGPATFLVIALEFVLAMGPLFAPRVRRCLLVLGLILHGAIVLVMGITSFSLVMAAALLLHLVPTNASYGDIFPRKRDWFVARQHAD